MTPAPLLSESRAILLALAAVLTFSLMDAAAKGLTARHDPLQVVWARYASQTFWTFVVLAPRLPTHLRTRRPGLQIVRSAFLFLATLGFFTGFTALPLAAVAAIFQTAPLYVTLIAVLFLGERVGLRRWAALAAGFAGALLIIRPGSDLFEPMALLVLAAAACNAGYAITTRMVGQAEGPWTNFAWATLLGTLVASVIVPFHWTTPTPEDAAIMAGLGLVGGLGHILLIFALRAAPASVLAPFTYAGLVFATLWGVLFFAEWPDAPTLLGALVIAGAGLYVWHRETRARRAGT